MSLETKLMELRRENKQLRKEIRRLESLLAKANKNSSTSSKPPSSDITKPAPKARPRAKGRKIGAQPGHPRNVRKNFPPEQVDERRHHRPSRCEHCGDRALQEEPGQRSRVFQQVEWVDKPYKVTEHISHAYRCECCQKTTFGALPAASRTTGLVGPKMQALLLFMKGALRLSYSSIQEFSEHVMGLKLSRGYLAKLMNKGAQMLASPVEALRSQLPDQPLLNVDETGHKENGKRMWTWVFRTPHFVLFSIQESRGTEVLLQILGKSFRGILGCDYFGAYRKFMREMSGAVQFCLAHLIRDLKFLAQHPDAVIRLYGEPILKAVGRMFQLIHQQVQEPVDQFEAKMQRCKSKILKLASRTEAISPVEWFVAENYPEVTNMVKRFQKHGESYFTFLTTPGMGPTNNAAEQALRFVVMDRKGTQGTRSSNGREFCERIWSVVGTCRMNQRSIFQYLCQATTAWANAQPIPSLLLGASTDSS